jgi:RNA polymerase sigma-70 factor (ECF subfamily)
MKIDIDSFEKLILQYEKLFYNIAYRIAGNSEDAKDVLQDSYIKIYKNIGKCYGEEFFKSWGARVVTNSALDFIKKRKPAEDIQDVVVAAKDSPPDEIIKKEESETIMKFLNSLPADQKTVIVLRDLNDFSYEEIGKILGAPLGTVKSRINRARLALRALLEQNDFKLV